MDPLHPPSSSFASGQEHSRLLPQVWRVSSSDYSPAFFSSEDRVVASSVQRQQYRSSSVAPQPPSIAALAHIEFLVHHLGAHNQPVLSVGNFSSLAPVDQWDAHDIGMMRSGQELSAFVLANPNITQNALLFQTDPVTGALLGCTLLYNSTAPSDSPDPRPALLRALDQANLAYHAQVHLQHEREQHLRPTDPRGERAGQAPTLSSPNISVGMASFPMPMPPFLPPSIVAVGGAFWFIMPPMLVFLFIIHGVSSEKELLLRQGMAVAGLLDSAYWTTWTLYGLMLNVLSAVVLIASGALAQIVPFQNANPVAVALALVMLGVGMLPIAFLFATLFPAPRHALSAGFLLFLTALLLQLAFLSAALYWWYSPFAPSWPRKIFIALYPPFNFSKVWADITLLAGQRFNQTTASWQPGPGYHLSDLYTPLSIPVYNISVPATTFSLLFLLCNYLMYLLLLLYFDNVLPFASPRTSRPLLYFLMPSYWLGGRSKPADPALAADRSQLLRIQGLSKRYDWNLLGVARRLLGLQVLDDQQSVDGKAAKTHQEDGDDKYDPAAARFERSPPRPESASEELDVDDDSDDTDEYDIKKPLLGTMSQSDSFSMELDAEVDEVEVDREEGMHLATRDLALDRVDLTIPQGHLLALLGVNGAGKSTLCRILCGLEQATSGSAELAGTTLLEGLGSQSRVSFCPQHDVLWPKLSPREHLSFFAMLRGDLDHDTDRMLAWLGLSEVADREAGALSGGMRRRLSLAIAAVGQPRLIVADEVSSGLDPANQAEVWHLVDKLKRGTAAILLTTHSMQEAERLADEVAILTDGRVCARGAPLLLKRHLCAPSQRSALAVHLRAASLIPQLLECCQVEVETPPDYRVRDAPIPGKPNSVLLFVEAQTAAESSASQKSFFASTSSSDRSADSTVSALLQALIEFCQRQHVQHGGVVQSWDLRSVSLGDIFERVTLAVREF
mmetsp:Transcript_6781/g.20633  ORF Transcript_6781/g.20633 Transcript_6781/m.20633 type:complete len:959 (-) Transcript_6781:66-2942(-)